MKKHNTRCMYVAFKTQRYGVNKATQLMISLSNNQNSVSKAKNKRQYLSYPSAQNNFDLKGF